MSEVLVSYLHYIGFATMAAALAMELVLFRPQVSGAVARRLARIDALYGLSALVVLGAALVHLLEIPFRSTVSHFIFRLAVINANGEPATISHLLVRWAIVWLPLLVVLSLLAWLLGRAEATAYVAASLAILLWIGVAGCSVIHPNRGPHDRLAGTWVVRR